MIHQAIDIPTLVQHMLCPMQCRMVGVTVNDCPKLLTPLPQEDFRCIIAADEFRARNVLPLSLQFLTSVLNVLK